MSRGLTGPLRTMGAVTAVTLVTLAAYLAAMLLLGRNLPRERFGYLTLWVYSLNLLGAASLLGFPNAILRHFPRERLRASRWPSVVPPLAALNLAVCAAGALAFHGIYGAPTGKRVRIPGITHQHVRDGRFVAEWTVFDELALMAQLYQL